MEAAHCVISEPECGEKCVWGDQYGESEQVGESFTVLRHPGMDSQILTGIEAWERWNEETKPQQGESEWW